MTSELTGDLQGVLIEAVRPTGWGIVVLGGSSGRVDVARAQVFADAGVTALAMRWFGGEGQSPGICEIPLESFAPATRKLSDLGCARIAYIGTSKGAEAALLVAAHDPRIDAVIALSPSSVVWAQTGPGRDGQEWPLRSSWTLAGRPLPFVPYDVAWWLEQAHEPPIRFRPYHERSLATFAAEAAAAAIPVERSRARIILVAGESDALWQSDMFAQQIAARLKAHGRDATLVTHPEAGHRVVLPGEPLTERPAARDWGGTDGADRALGKEAWKAIEQVLEIAPRD